MGINAAPGDLSATHIFGIGFQYALSNHRFSQLTSLTPSPIGFTFNAGAEYFFGKKDIYDITYKGYSFVHAFAGLILNSGLNGNISLTGGPSISIYTSSTLFGFGMNFNGNFYLSRNTGISPAILLMKQQDINSICIASVRGSFSF